MLNSILYILSVICLIWCFLKLKKQDKELNLVKWIIISLILLFCFNSILVFILSYIKIKSNLLTLSIIYLSFSIILYFKYIYKKSVQKYFVDKKDIIVALVLFIVTILIAFIRFGFPFSIVYQTMDPGVHFQSAHSFYKESILLNFAQDNTIFNFETWRFASYTNLGLIFKFVSPFILESNFYNIYILYDLFTFFLTGMLFYYVINYSKKSKILYLVITIFFLAGYPLNNLLIGFFYVGHVSLIIMTILLLINELKDDNCLLYLLIVLNLGLTFTYYLFLPFVFLAEFVYFIKTKKIIKKYFFMFGMPLIFGFLYFVLPTFTNNNMNLINQTKIDGYFYNDVIGNVILFFPIICYYIYSKFKEKKFDIDSLMLVFLTVFMIVLTILMILGVILPYYVSKYYYILWILCFVIFSKTYNTYYSTNKLIFNIYFVFMGVIILFSTLNIEKKIIDLNEGDWNKTTPTMMFNVYRYNINLIDNAIIALNDDELVELKKEIDVINDQFMTNIEPEKIFWLINFIEPNPINCPINQVYDCIKHLYQGDFKNFVEDDNKIQYIFFNRSIYSPYDFSYESIDDILNVSQTYNYVINKFDFGYIINKRSE